MRLRARCSRVGVAPAKFLASPSPGAIIGPELVITVSSDDPYFASVECFVDGVSLGVSADPHFTPTVSTLTRLDGSAVVACTAVDRAGNRGSESAEVTIRNWSLDLQPAQLNLNAKYGNSPSQLTIEGANVSTVVPVGTHAFTLRVAGGSPVAWSSQPGTGVVGDVDADGIPDVVIRFDRAALLSSIKAGISAGKIDATKPVSVGVYSANRLVGTVTVIVK